MTGIYIAGGRFRLELDNDDSRDRLSETVGQLLQVRNFSILVGAGASFELGSPKIRAVDRSDVASMVAGVDTELDERSNALLDQLFVTPVDLEAVLQRLNAAIGYLRAFGVEQLELGGEQFAEVELRNAYAAINIGLANSCDLPPDGTDEATALAPHAEFFRKLIGARRGDLPRIGVFTTNYDLVVEKALDLVGIRYLDGFRGGVSRQLDLSSYAADMFARVGAETSALVRVHELLHLYKVHGSLDWRQGPEGHQLRASGIVQSADKATVADLAVIYPTPAKDSDVLGYPYSDLLRIFGTSLAQPESALMVVGYGFADDHINRLIEQALAFNRTLQVLVVDPFKVVDEDAELPDIEFSDSIVGRLAAAKDNRISVLTGDAARFAVLHELLPDVDPPSGPDLSLPDQPTAPVAVEG